MDFFNRNEIKMLETLFKLEYTFQRIQRFHNKEKRRKPYFVFKRIFHFNQTRLFRTLMNNITDPIVPGNLIVYPMLKLIGNYDYA